jgi:hypothetical protein
MIVTSVVSTKKKLMLFSGKYKIYFMWFEEENRKLM